MCLQEAAVLDRRMNKWNLAGKSKTCRASAWQSQVPQGQRIFFGHTMMRERIAESQARPRSPVVTGDFFCHNIQLTESLELVTNKQNHRFQKLTKRLEALQYGQTVINRLRDLNSLEDSIARLIDIRIALEKFLEDSARLSPRYGGPRFNGDFSRPPVVRDYLERGSWITKEELQFISAFYGLLSNADGHAGDSMLDPLTAKHTLWSVVDTISHRILNRPKRYGVTRQGKIEQALANEFVEALRAGESEGRAFEPTFTESTMKKVRQRLTKNDTEALWKLMENSFAHPELRNRSASLLLGERLAEDPEEQGRIAEAMRRYYADNRSAPWQLRRAIALALANQTGDAEPLRSYLSEIKTDSELLELNLRTTDTWYRSTENAISIFLQRIGNRRLSTANCVWELFYVSRRISTEKDRAIGVIRNRAEKTHDSELKALCLDCLGYLKRGSRDTPHA